MFDPVTISLAVATASTAFNGIKRAFAAGRDFESMAGDLSRWMGAVSDVDAAHKSANNPSMLRKVLNAKSIEEEAIEAFALLKNNWNNKEMTYALLYSFLRGNLGGKNSYAWKQTYVREDRKKYTTRKSSEKRS